MNKQTSKSDLKRDREVTREIHNFFWRAFLHRPLYFWTTVILHPPIFFVINVLVPLEVAYGIQAIITRNFDAVAGYAWLVLGLMAGSQLFFMLATLAFNRLGSYGGAYVQRKAFASYLDKDYDFYSNQFIGALGAQSARLRDAFEDYGRIMLFDVPKTIVIISTGMLVIAFSSVQLALLTAVFVMSVVLATIYISKLRLKYRRLLSNASNELAGVLGDSLSHGATVKSYAKEADEEKRLERPLSNWIKAQLITWDTSIPSTVIRHGLLGLTMAGLLLASAHLYRDGQISIAIVAMVQLYLIRVVTSTLDINEIIKKYESIMSSSYDPVATMMIPITIKDPAHPKKLPAGKAYEIVFDAVGYKYPEAAEHSQAVKDFSLTVNKGEKIGLVGYSGGGKTTITKLLLRFMDVTDGSIRLGGTNVREVSQANLRNLISYVPQEPLLFHRSIKDNIIYSRPEASENEFEQAVKTAYINEFAAELPAGYDSMVGERGVKLSGGQRQRVAIARALLKDAPILVLDEATSGLDSQSEKYIQKALWQLMKDRTAIVIAHRLSTIQKMDRIVVMDKGRIVQTGSHRQLLNDPDGIYAKLWSHQSDGYLAEA